jgi:O-antigen/teichoic acid export membrane protein
MADEVDRQCGSDVRMTTVADEDDARPSLARQATWLLVAKTIGFALTFGLPLVLVRTLTQHDFGVYKQAFLVVVTAVTVLPLGFGMTAFYFLPREPERRGAVLLHVLLVHSAIGTIAAVGLWLWPGLIAAAFNSPELRAYSPVLGAVICTWTIGSILEIIPVARGEIRASTILIVFSQASKTLLFIVSALTIGSVSSLIRAALVQGIVQIGVLLLYLRSAVPGYWRCFEWEFLRRQGSYALPLGLSAVLLRFQLDLPHYFIAHHFGASLYAIYAVGVLNLPLIGLLRESIGSVLLPRVSLLEAQQNPRPILELLARASRKLALVYFPVYVALMVVGRDFIVFLFTRQYLDSWPIFAVNLTLLPLGVLVLDPITRAFAGQRFFVLKLRVTLLAATALILWFGTARLGTLGVVTSVVAIQVIAIVATVWKLAHVMSVGRTELASFSGLGRIASAAVLAGVACGLTRQVLGAAAPLLTICVCGALYFITYAGLLIVLDVLTPDERAMLRWLPPGRVATIQPSSN